MVTLMFVLTRERVDSVELDRSCVGVCVCVCVYVCVCVCVLCVDVYYPMATICGVRCLYCRDVGGSVNSWVWSWRGGGG